MFGWVVNTNICIGFFQGDLYYRPHYNGNDVSDWGPANKKRCQYFPSTQVTFYLEFHLRHWKIVSREKLLNGNWFHHIFHARQSFWWASYQLQMVWYAKRYQNNFAKYLAPFSVQISFEWKTPSCGSKTPTTSKMELLLALVNSFQ